MLLSQQSRCRAVSRSGSTLRRTNARDVLRCGCGWPASGERHASREQTRELGLLTGISVQPGEDVGCGSVGCMRSPEFIETCGPRCAPSRKARKQERHLPHEAVARRSAKPGRYEQTSQAKGMLISGDQMLENKADALGSLALLGRSTLLPVRNGPAHGA